MKKSLGYLLVACLSYLIGTMTPGLRAQTARLDGDSQNSLSQVYVQRVGAEVENSIQALNGNWSITDAGVIYATQIVLEPQPLTALLPVDGAMIFLDSPVQLAFGYNGTWHYSELIPESEWADSDITTDGDFAMYYNGQRYLGRTADWTIQ